MKNQILFAYDISMGKHCLPNAATLQSVLMHYFLNLNDESNLWHHDPVFDKIFDFVDGNKYGGIRRDWGYSYIGGSQSMIKYASYQQVTVQECRSRNCHYIYPINIGPWFSRFTSNKVFSESNKIGVGDFFFTKMSQASINDITAGRATLLLDYTQENFISKLEWEDFHEVIKMTSFPKDNVLVYFNTFNGRDLYESWFTEEERQVTVVNCPYLLAWNMDKHTLISEKTVLESKTNIRKNYFTLKNNSPREHRKMLLLALFQLGLHLRSNWSWLSDYKFSQEDNTNLLNNKIIDKSDIDMIPTEKLNETLPKNLVGESIGVSTPGWGEINSTYEPYLNSYFDIVTETFYDNQSNEKEPWYKHESLTEKVWKPIAFYQPFIVVSWPGTLAKMRELGFKTYHPYIDESYDLEIDPNRRLRMVINEIIKLCNKTPEELHEWYWNMWGIIKHNHDKLADTWKNSQYAESMQILIDKCKH